MRARALDDAIASRTRLPTFDAGLSASTSGRSRDGAKPFRPATCTSTGTSPAPSLQRQPFGGWKRSAIGPGAKAGAPTTWRPSAFGEPTSARSHRFATAAKQCGRPVPARHRCHRAARERNSSVTARPPAASSCAPPGCRPGRDRILPGGGGLPPRRSASRARRPRGCRRDRGRRRVPRSVKTIAAGKVRVLAIQTERSVSTYSRAAPPRDVAFVGDPRVELHRWVREQAISETRHRHGNLIARDRR